MFLGIMLISVGGGLTATGALAPFGIILIIVGVLHLKNELGGGTKKNASASGVPKAEPAPKAAPKPAEPKPENPAPKAKPAQHMPPAPKTVEPELQVSKAAKPIVTAASSNKDKQVQAAEPAKAERAGKKHKCCSFCGAELKPDDLFCSECGSML